MCSRLSVVEIFGDWKNLVWFLRKVWGFFCAAPSVNIFFLQSLLKDGPNLSASYIRQATRIKICINQETHWPANRNLFSKHELPSIMARGFVLMAFNMTGIDLKKSSHVFWSYLTSSSTIFIRDRRWLLEQNQT